MIIKSTTSPFSINRILSENVLLDILWEIYMAVFPSTMVLKCSYISASAKGGSSADVGSSNIISGASL